MQRDGAQKPVTLESLVDSTILSLAMLIYGAYGLYANDFLLPTRVGVQHLDRIDAIVFYVVAIAVPDQYHFDFAVEISESPGVFLLYMSDNLFQIVPRHFFSSLRRSKSFGQS
jgi:hypothetical protein